MEPAALRAAPGGPQAVRCQNALAWSVSSAGGASQGLRLAAGAGAILASAASAQSSNGPTMASDDLSHELYADEQRTVGLFERCSKSVVHINTSQEREVMVRGLRGMRLEMQEIPQGTGSGFVWDAQHIVTNFHVIKDADAVTVVLSDNSSHQAELVGVEPDCDLAVLRLRRDSAGGQESLVPLERGRSNNLHVGQRVYAIGNPFGLDQTLTSGIVSGLGREMRGVSGRTIRGLVQTDAAINPGNSGGPLLNARGRLIGVNTMIASPSGAFAGVGFAIPVDTVERVVNQIVRFGHTRKAFLGVYPAPDHIAQQLSQRFRGALVLQVVPQSPADELGLQPTTRTRDGRINLGDQIISVGGQTVDGAETLMNAVEECDISQQVEVVYRRRGEPSERSGTVQLRERPPPEGARGGAGHGQGSTPVAESRPRARL